MKHRLKKLKDSILKTKTELKDTRGHKTKPKETVLRVEYSKGKRKHLKKDMARIMRKIINGKINGKEKEKKRT